MWEQCYVNCTLNKRGGGSRIQQSLLKYYAIVSQCRTKKLTSLMKMLMWLASVFFPPSLTSKLNVQVVKTMATAAGINLPKRQNLKETLITLGRELYSAGKVELSKSAGLTRSDIEHK